MKRITLLIIAFFMVALCSVAGGVLLSGCSNKDDNSNEIGGNATSGYRIYFDLNYDNIPVNYFDPYYVKNMEPLAFYVENGHYQTSSIRTTSDVYITITTYSGGQLAKVQNTASTGSVLTASNSVNYSSTSLANYGMGFTISGQNYASTGRLTKSISMLYGCMPSTGTYYVSAQLITNYSGGALSCYMSNFSVTKSATTVLSPCARTCITGPGISYTLQQSGDKTASVSLPKPTRAGYKFAGWYTSKIGGELVTDSFFVTSSRTVYAHWVENNGNATLPTSTKITAYRNSGTETLPRTNQISSISLSYYGYGFAINSNGYLESQNAGVNNSYSMVCIRFSAKASSTFTIQYISYGESNYDYAIFSNLDQALSESYSADTTYYKRTYGEASSAVKTLTYSGISSGSHEIYIKFRKDGSTHSYNDSLQLWFGNDWFSGTTTAEPYKVHFVGMRYGALPTMSRTGYTFNGWYTAASGGTQITESSIFNSSSIYPHWTVKSYTLYLDANGGSSTRSFGVSYGTSSYSNISSYLPTRTGYTFLGFTNSPSGGTYVYDASGAYTGNYVSDWGNYLYSGGTLAFDGTNGQYIYIYAQWKVNTYTVTLEANQGNLSNVGYSSTAEWSFSGTNYQALGRTYMYTDKLYISAEAYMDDWSRYANSEMRIISCTEGGGWNIEGYTGNIDFSCYDSGYGYRIATASTSWASLSSGWHKFEMSFDGNRVCGYLDGTLVATSEMFSSGKIGYNTSNGIFVGAEASNNTSAPENSGKSFFVGKIRNLKILNTFKAKTVTYNSSYGTLPTPIRDTYTFDGWYTSVSGGTQIATSTTYTAVNNTTLYAHWTPVSITNNVYLRVISPDGKTVSASSNGGNVDVYRYVIPSSGDSYSTETKQTSTSSTYSVHSSKQFYLTAYANSGYEFVGFSKSPSPSDSIKNPSSKPTNTFYEYPTSGRDYYVYFKQLSANQLKHDDIDKYYYFEDGYYPQSEVTNTSTLNSSAIETGESIKYTLGSEEKKYTVGDYDVIGREYMYEDKLTVSLWAYMDNWASYADDTMRIISCTENGGWNIEPISKCINFAMFDKGYGYKSATSNVLWESLSSGWHMFTMTFDGQYGRGYLDGKLIATSERYQSGKIGYNATNAIFVGAEPGSSGTSPVGGYYFQGKIKAITIQNDVFDASEIQTLYNGKTLVPVCDAQIPVYSYGGDRFVKIAMHGQVKWFKFEPIRWRVSDYGVENSKSNFDKYSTLLKFKNYASYSDNFMAVSDLILGVGAMHSTRVVSEGDKVEEMAAFQNIQNMSNLTPDTLKANYNKTGNLINVDSYSGYGSGQINAVNKNNTITYSSQFRICSTGELEEVGFVNKQARASDMVAFILGLNKNQVSYWTRDLSNLGAGVAITPTGTIVRPWLDEVLGMRFAYTFREGSSAF